MDAGTLNCPMCGAPTRTNNPNCGHCGARLATVACPSCFGMIFSASKFCPHCGAQARRLAGSDTQLPCPKCKMPLGEVALGATPVHECPACFGLWVEASTFDEICKDREKQSAVLGSATELFRPGDKAFDMNVRYVPCPICKDLMHRVNFAKCSGIVVDVCRGHGTWFDRDELQHIVQFIRTGGLDLAREKEKAELEAARRRLAAARQVVPERSGHSHHSDFEESDLISIAGSLLTRLLR